MTSAQFTLKINCHHLWWYRINWNCLVKLKLLYIGNDNIGLILFIMNWTKMTTLTYLYLLWISGNYTLSVRVVFFENLDKFNCWKTTDIKLIREIIISEKLNIDTNIFKYVVKLNDNYNWNYFERSYTSNDFSWNYFKRNYHIQWRL